MSQEYKRKYGRDRNWARRGVRVGRAASMAAMPGASASSWRGADDALREVKDLVVL